MVFWLSTLYPISSRSRRVQISSLRAWRIAIYSDSVLERATELCFFDDHDTAPPANVNTNPETDSLPSSVPQFASLQHFKFNPNFPLYEIPSSIVPLRYLKACFAAFS